MDTPFNSNATIQRDYIGRTPFILGCDTHEVLVPAGTRVQVLETKFVWTVIKTPFGKLGFHDQNKPYFLVRFPSDKAGYYWTLWLGSAARGVADVVKLD